MSEIRTLASMENPLFSQASMSAAAAVSSRRVSLAKSVREWLGRVGVKTLFIEPGSPWENGYIESFNGKLRDELLEREAFDTLLEAKVLIERWRQHYNTIRPHSALGYRPPAPEAWQPRAFASATPQQTHGAGLLEGKILT